MKKEKTSQIRLSSDNSIILFDGFCNLCSWSVQFILKRDSKDYFRFASLQSDIAEKISDEFNIPKGFYKSLVLIENNRVYFQSNAALKIARKLRGLWPIFYVFILIPKPVRDYIYNIIAINRFKWFGKKDNCYTPTKKYSEKFL
jgi:predicted DCC family thiol-disulfide oxidoreductase YuxK